MCYRATNVKQVHTSGTGFTFFFYLFLGFFFANLVGHFKNIDGCVYESEPEKERGQFTVHRCGDERTALSCS